MSNAQQVVPNLQVGDVIASPAFVNGWHYRNLYDGVVDEQLLWVTDAAALGYGNRPQPDETRGQAQYVIEESRPPLANCLDSVHVYNDGRPDGWWSDIEGSLITARRLCEDGSYDPDGEQISFVWHMSERALREIQKDRRGGSAKFTRTILPSSLTVVGHMRRIFV